ncbi:MAG: efflux transporter periplasmic adaptor subunit, partial [Pseudomonadota bacterium]
MRFLARSLIGLLLAALTLGLMGYGGLRLSESMRAAEEGKPGPRAPRERIYAVEVAPILEERLRPMVVAYGEVMSARRLELRPVRGGALTALSSSFRDGGRVEAGELLFRTDPAMARSDLSRAEIALHEAEVEERLASEALALARRDLTGAQDRAVIQANILARQQD